MADTGEPYRARASPGVLGGHPQSAGQGGDPRLGNVEERLQWEPGRERRSGEVRYTVKSHGVHVIGISCS